MAVLELANISKHFGAIHVVVNDENPYSIRPGRDRRRAQAVLHVLSCRGHGLGQENDELAAGAKRGGVDLHSREEVDAFTERVAAFVVTRLPQNAYDAHTTAQPQREASFHRDRQGGARTGPSANGLVFAR